MPNYFNTNGKDDAARPLVMQESAEMYLETILILQREGKRVRSIDVATRMDHSRPTVSEWMKKLVSNGYLVIDSNGTIDFTDAGRAKAEHIYERHVMLTKLFESVGVSPGTAAGDACRVEHYISDETFDCLKRHYEDHSL